MLPWHQLAAESLLVPTVCITNDAAALIIKRFKDTRRLLLLSPPPLTPTALFAAVGFSDRWDWSLFSLLALP